MSCNVDYGSDDKPVLVWDENPRCAFESGLFAASLTCIGFKLLRFSTVSCSSNVDFYFFQYFFGININQLIKMVHNPKDLRNNFFMAAQQINLYLSDKNKPASFFPFPLTLRKPYTLSYNPFEIILSSLRVLPKGDMKIWKRSTS